MAKTVKYYIVAADALPEIFIKVAEAKRMMQTGEVDTVGEATKRA
jgi:chorismate mutase